MIIVAIFYLIMLIGSVLFYVMFKDDFSFYVLTLVLTTPPLLLISVLLTKRKLTVSLSCSKQVCRYGSECPVFLNIENKSFMPVSNLKIAIGLRNSLDGAEQEIVINTPAHFKNTENIRLMLSSSYCGRIEVYIKKVRIYDFIRLFSFRLKSNQKPVSFLIYPRLEAIEPNVSYYSNPYSESDSYSKHKTGDDVSEIFGLHDYVPGDKINRIHWKVSAKEDKLIVKDYSLPLGNNIAFFVCISMEKNKDKAVALQNYSTAMSVVASVSLALCDSEVSHTVFTNNDTGYSSFNVTKSEELTQLLADSLSAKLSDCNPFRVYEEYLSDCERSAASYYSHCIIICDGNSADLSKIIGAGYQQLKQTIISVTDFTDTANSVPENTSVHTVSGNMATVLSEMTI